MVRPALLLLARLALSSCAPPPLPLRLGDLVRACRAAGGIEQDTATGLNKPAFEAYGRITCRLP